MLKKILDYFRGEEVEWQLMTVTEHAKMPKQANPGDAGMDLYAAEEAEIQPGCVALVSTGLIGEIPNGYEIQIRPRSGLAVKNYVTVINAPGTVDAGYRDVIKVALINFAQTPYRVLPGDRIAQAVIQKLPKVKLKEVQAVTKSIRGTGGFGSSGK